LLVLPIKYIYELQRRSLSNTEFMINTNGDIQSMTESSNNRNNAPENDRDKLLIQPIVCKIFI